MERGVGDSFAGLAEGRAGGESAARLFLAALPPRIRFSFEIFGALPKSSK
ncbi:hypothetical protein [Lapidilactobacillus salsurivasis]